MMRRDPADRWDTPPKVFDVTQRLGVAFTG